MRGFGREDILICTQELKLLEEVKISGSRFLSRSRDIVDP